MYEYKAIVKRVIDGDTIEVIIDLGFSVTIEQAVRLNRINAFETRLGKNTSEEQKEIGIEAREYLKNLIEGKEIIIKTIKPENDKYGRFLGEIFFDGLNINDDLVTRKYAIYQDY